MSLPSVQTCRAGGILYFYISLTPQALDPIINPSLGGPGCTPLHPYSHFFTLHFLFSPSTLTTFPPSLPTSSPLSPSPFLSTPLTHLLPLSPLLSFSLSPPLCLYTLHSHYPSPSPLLLLLHLLPLCCLFSPSLPNPWSLLFFLPKDHLHWQNLQL